MHNHSILSIILPPKPQTNLNLNWHHFLSMKSMDI